MHFLAKTQHWIPWQDGDAEHNLKKERASFVVRSFLVYGHREAKGSNGAAADAHHEPKARMCCERNTEAIARINQ